MRILFAALSLPYPPVSGHRLRTWSLLQALARDGHEITLVSFLEPGETIEPPLQALCEGIETEPAPRAGSALGRLLSLGSSSPHGAVRFRSPSFRQRLATLLTGGRFDLVLCDGVYNVVNLPEQSNVPVVLNKDDVAHVILERYAAIEKNPLRRAYAQLEAAKVKRFEREAARGVQAILACSEVDAALLRELCPHCRIEVVPNVVDTDHYRPQPGEQSGVVLFQGSMDWHPNLDGALWFAREALPEIRRRRSDVVFRVAGRQASPRVRETLAAIPGLQLRTDVPDMRDEIAQAQVCVVPLRIGSGTRMKILEAAAMGRAVVSTSLGSEGLEFAAGDEIVIANEPLAFAEEVVRLLESPHRRDVLGSAARRHIERSYSAHSLDPALRSALRPTRTERAA